MAASADTVDRVRVAVYASDPLTRSALAALLVSRAEVGLAGLAIPAIALGIALSVMIRRRVRPDSIRSGVLIVCAASAIALLVRAAF